MSGLPARSNGRPASLLARLANWWEGVEPAPPPAVAAAPSPAAPQAEPPRGTDVRRWSAERIEVAQLLYGPGWIAPGGEALHRELVTPLTLNAAHSVVVHGAALAGAARMIACDTEAWVDAVEDRPLLAAEAARQVKAAGLGKKVVVIPQPLAAAEIKPRSRHAAISFDALHRVADKAAELARLRAALKPGGQLLLTDFVRGAEADAAALERWSRADPAPVHFATADELSALLQRQGFDVRVCEDRSEIYCRAALSGLQEFLRSVEAQPVPDRLRPWLIGEVEALTVRLQALEAGAVGHCRIYGLLPA